MTDEPTQQGPGPEGEERPPTEEEMAAAFVYRLGRIPVRDIMLQTMATMSDVGGIRLGLGPEGETVREIGVAGGLQRSNILDHARAIIGIAERCPDLVCDNAKGKGPRAMEEARMLHDRSC